MSSSSIARRLKLRLQTLEDRSLLAASAFLNSDGVLIVRGTQAVDQIVVEVEINHGNDYVKVSGTFDGSGYIKLFEASDFKFPAMKFFGYDGNDRFTNNTLLYSEAYGGDGDDRLSGGNSFDYLVGGDGHDELLGYGDGDKILGGDGQDTMSGFGGNDTIYGQLGEDTLHGDNDNDELYGGADDDVLNGGSGDDSLYGSNGNDGLYGEAGNDEIYGGADNDLIYGNFIYGDNYFGQYQESLFGGSGQDTLYGASGNDVLNGQNGHDLLYGYEGSDEITGWNGNDTAYGGVGNDTLYGSAGRDSLFGEYGDDEMHGGGQDDLLDGDFGRDTLYGSGGRDRLLGGYDPDYLDGGAGNDGLFGGLTNETLIGGSGADRLVYFEDQAAALIDTSGDALLLFRNGSQQWTHNEIGVAETAFTRIAEVTGGTTFLRDPVRQGPLTFVNDDLEYGTLGRTTLNKQVEYIWKYYRPFNLEAEISYPSRTIQIKDWSDDTEAFDTFIHEVGHNWQPSVTMTEFWEQHDAVLDEYFQGLSKWSALGPELDRLTTSTRWRKFLAISGWKYFKDPPSDTTGLERGYFAGELTNWWYKTSASGSFFGEYGKFDPYEDWATTWAELFKNPLGGGITGYSDALQDKLDVVRTLVL